MAIYASYTVENVLINVTESSTIIPNDNNLVREFLISEYGLGDAITDVTTAQDDGYIRYESAQSQLFDDESNAVVLWAPDNGFTYSLGLFDGGNNSVNGGNYIAVSSYAQTITSSAGSLYFSFLSTGTDVRDGRCRYTTFSGGDMFYITSSYYTGYMILAKGSLHLVSLSTQLDIGYFRANSNAYIRGATGATRKIYSIIARFFTISGTITDYYETVLGGIEIGVYNKNDKTKIGEGVSGYDGTYNISIKGSTGDECVLVFFAPNDSSYQSKVVDSVILI